MHDVVVVGAGGSGIPLAVRMAEAGITVLLVEEGHAATDPAFDPDVRTILGAQPHHPLVRHVEAELWEGRPWGLQSGRVLGGSTRVNGGHFIWARRSDFDRCSAVGGERWSYDRALPVLRRLESDEEGAPDLHGRSGPMTVERSGTTHPVAAALLEACVAAASRSIPTRTTKPHREPDLCR